MAAQKANPTRITLERRRVVRRILKDRGDALVVTGIGNASQDCAAAGDHAGNFYLFGIMGGAAMVGLGMALAQPKRRVVVITGDGELLAGIGSLATIGMQAPRNLGIVVIDNQAYGATGMQDTHTGHGVDLAAIARGSGFPGTAIVTTTGELDAVLPGIHHEPGPFLAVVKVQTKATTRIKVPNDGPYMRDRFRRALLGDAADD